MGLTVLFDARKTGGALGFWGARASIQAFENGLVKGIDASIRHRYTMRRSLGDPVCEIHLSHTG